MDGIVAYALSKKAIGAVAGDLETLTTVDKTSLVGSINELNENAGDLDTLTTVDKTSLVGAINEVMASEVQPDWNQNDSTAADYIQNRPFYKGDENIITLIPETTIAVTDGQASLEVEDGGVVFNIAKDNAGKIVKIQYNDVIEYGYIAEDEGSYYIPTRYANIDMNNNVYQISVYDLDTANIVFHASIDNTEINKISSDYLPIPPIEGTGVSSIILNGSLSACNADGDCAVAEGSYTTASGSYSHAEGDNTTANHRSQHVFGEYNIADPSSTAANARGNYVEIVGNGTHSTKSNARALDWSGNEWLAGNLTAAGGTITVGSTALTEAKLQELLSLSSASGVSF